MQCVTVLWLPILKQINKFKCFLNHSFGLNHSDAQQKNKLTTTSPTLNLSLSENNPRKCAIHPHFPTKMKGIKRQTPQKTAALMKIRYAEGKPRPKKL